MDCTWPRGMIEGKGSKIIEGAPGQNGTSSRDIYYCKAHISYELSSYNPNPNAQISSTGAAAVGAK